MGQDKLWLDVNGSPLIAVTLSSAGAAGCFGRVVMAAPSERGDELRRLASAAGFNRIDVVQGGDRRQDSVYAALQLVDDDHVCVHDAARPLVSPRLFREVVAVAQAEGAATAGIACVDTVKRAHDGHIVETLPRAELIATQTPQAFSTYLLKHAHEAARAEGVEGDDDSYLVERLGQRVAVVPGDPRNIKVTHEQDLRLVRALLEIPV